MCSRAPGSRICFVEQPQLHFHHWKQKNGEHENVVKQLKQVQTLHHISQSCCEWGTVKKPNHIRPALTCTTPGVCFLKLPKTFWSTQTSLAEMWFYIFTRSIFIYFSQKLSTIGHSSQLCQSNFTRLERNIYEIFKLKLSSGLFNAIKKQFLHKDDK